MTQPATYHSALDSYQAQTEAANIDRIINDFYLQFKPHPRLSVSQWADRYRHLPPESAAEPGRWQTSRVPYLRDIMDAVNDPAVHTVVVMTASQIGKSEALNNILFYYSHQDPCPILLIQPTLTDAEDYSKSRLSTSIRDSAVLREIFGEEKSRNSNNTIFKKNFPGGRMVLVGANSPSGLSSKPIRVVLADEIDRYEATKEGSAVRLASQRSATFFNRKMILTSTPSTAGVSEVERWYNLSDKRKYFVPCSECGEYILLNFKNVIWDKDESGAGIPETARYCCQECGVLLTQNQIWDMTKSGEWRATAPFNGIAGFGEFPALYSPWKSMKQIVEKFLQVKDDSDELKTWINLDLGQCYEEKHEKVNPGELFSRREVYNLIVPREACFVTCAADIQKDRIEALVCAWGMDEECFIMEHKIFYGDTSEISRKLGKTDIDQLTFEQISEFTAADKVEGVWKQFDDFRKTTYEHESGELLRIAITVIDTGYETDQVYNFIRPREREGVLGIKGVDGAGKPAVDRPSRKNKVKIQLYSVGTFTVKDSMKARLGKNRPGPGYIHIPDRVDQEFCEQLASEKKVIRETRGQKKIEWVKIRQRNEAWDLLCYNFAALRIRFQVRDLLNLHVKKFNAKVYEKQQEKEKQKSEEIRIAPRRKPGGFVKNW